MSGTLGAPHGDHGTRQTVALKAFEVAAELPQKQEQKYQDATGQLLPVGGGGSRATAGGSPQASSRVTDPAEVGAGNGGAAYDAPGTSQAATDPTGDDTGGSSKRDYVRWAPEEEEVFYSALRGVTGQKPEVCLKEITARLAGSKDYAQVRHYYYRLIKRLNRILGVGSTLDTKNPLQVHRSMIKFWEVFVDKGMRGTCMVGIMKKPRKQRELSTTVQRGVAAVVKLTNGGGGSSKAAVSGSSGPCRASTSRKRKLPGVDAAECATGVGGAQGDDEMMEAAPPLPAKQQRRTNGPSTRQQQLLAVTEAEVAAGSAAGDTAAAAEGSLQSQTDANEGGGNAPLQPASSSQTMGSQQRESEQPLHLSTAHSFRSSSDAGLSATMLEGSMGRDGCGKLRLQLVPLDTATAEAMSAAGYHPFLELTLGTGKSLQSVLRHLGSKWQQAASSASSGAGGALYVHPPFDCPIPLRGVCWGGPVCDSQLKVGDIYTTLHSPNPFQLRYSWCGMSATTSPAVEKGRRRTTLHRQQAAEAAQLTVNLREALSVVATATTPAAHAAGLGPSAAARTSLAQDLQEQRGPGPESFLQLLQNSDLAQHAAVETEVAATAPSPGVLAKAEHVDGQCHTAAISMQPGAITAVTMHPAATPVSACQGNGTPTHTLLMAESAACGTLGGADPTPGTVGPRKPCGLLGLLQTPAVKGTPATTTKKQSQSQRRTARSASTGGRQGSQAGRWRQPQQREQQQPLPQPMQLLQPLRAAAAPHSMPAGFGPLMLAPLHMHPHLQQQHPHPPVQQPAMPILQQPSLLQLPPLQAQQPLPLNPPQQGQETKAPTTEQSLPPALDFGSDSLFHLLDPGSNAAAAAGGRTLLFFGSPNNKEQRQFAGALLPGSNDFSLKSWPTLSPPSDFQLPDGFETGLSPVRKATEAIAQPMAAGTLTAGVKGEIAAKTAAVSPDGRAALALGPTNFSLMLADVSAHANIPSSKQQGTAARVADAQQQEQHHQQPALTNVAAVQSQQKKCSGITAEAQLGPDALFGSASLLRLLGAPTQQLVDGVGPAGAALPLVLPDKELADLTFDFGSLLEVGDAAPSWQAPPNVGSQPTQQQMQAVGDRPFASLFGK